MSIIKNLIRENFGLEIDESYIRVRIVNKFGEKERILKGNDIQISKLKLDNPANLVFEILTEPEDLKESQIQLDLLMRDSTKRNYHSKKELIFSFNRSPDSDVLYQFIRDQVDSKNISIAKYFRHFHVWEEITELENGLPYNLKKSSYCLKEGGFLIFK